MKLTLVTPQSVSRERGFTLIELLTIIAIIGILAAIVIPVVGTARSRARESRDTGTLRNTSAGIMLMLHENKTSVAGDLKSGTKLGPYMGSAQAMSQAFYSEQWMEVVGRQATDVDYPNGYTINSTLWPSGYDPSIPGSNPWDLRPTPAVSVLAQARKPMVYSGVRFDRYGAYGWGGVTHVNPVYSGVAHPGPNFNTGAYPSAKALVMFADGSVRMVDFARDNKAEWWAAAN